MSSDSGESHASARNEDGGNEEPENVTLASLMRSRDTEVSKRQDRNIPGQEEELQELGSEANTTNGPSFARPRRHQNEEDEESLSELPARPELRRSGSPESASIPDDTPSIQVGA